MGKKIEYTNGELTIVWQPELCQHAGICVKMLPNVYHPKERLRLKGFEFIKMRLLQNKKMRQSHFSF